MADPRVVGPQERKANHSPLMVAKTRAALGEKVNFCPFGCTDDELDENWHCRHLVGFTVPGNDKLYEPLLPPNERGYRIVQVKRIKKEGKEIPVYESVRKGDKLEKITVCSRVYRDIDAEPSKRPEPAPVA